MADHVERDDVDRFELHDYSAIRPLLRSGDLMFASGDYLVSRAIRHCTDSPWSHVGVVFVLNAIDRVLLLESVEDVGVRLAPLSKYLHDYEDGSPYNGCIVMARCAAIDADPDVVKGIAGFGVDELTRPYDRAEIARILARILLGCTRAPANREYICSELVYECFAHGGIQFGSSQGFITPEDIWRDRRVSPLFRVRVAEG